MKRLLLILILTFSFQSLTKADDIRDFEIEGMSIGDSLLDFMSITEIKNDLKTEIASYAVSKKIWGEANKLLSDIPEEKLTNKAYQVLADISGSQNNAEKVKHYLEKAANAIQGKHYHCSSCGIKNDKWELHCPKCEALSSIRWMSISDIEITNSLSLSNTFSSLNKNLIDKKN